MKSALFSICVIALTVSLTLAEGITGGSNSTLLNANSTCTVHPLTPQDEAGVQGEVRALKYLGFDKTLAEMEVRTLACGEILIVEIEKEKIAPGTIRLGGEVLLMFIQTSEDFTVLHHQLIN